MPPPLTTPLVFERRPSEPGRSQFRVRLPAGRLPIVALDLDVGGGHVLREARVFEARLAGGEVVPTPLGTAMLKRVVQGDLTASALRVPIEAPIEPQLDLVIDDGNNPPIDLKGVTAVFAELPWIYFESTGDAAVARYGHPSLAAPRYRPRGGPRHARDRRDGGCVVGRGARAAERKKWRPAPCRRCRRWARRSTRVSFATSVRSLRAMRGW